jgi:hypothetical protein
MGVAGSQVDDVENDRRGQALGSLTRVGWIRSATELLLYLLQAGQMSLHGGKGLL